MNLMNIEAMYVQCYIVGHFKATANPTKEYLRIPK